MGPVCYCIYTAFTVVLLAVPLSCAVERGKDFVMIRSPEPLAVPIGDEVTLECEMNIKADNFRWRHYPISSPYSNTPVKLDRARSYEVSNAIYKNYGKSTTIFINVTSAEKAGDYQCLATYGASVLASIPGRITIAEIGNFSSGKNSRYTVAAGNSVAIHCDLPLSNPPASVEYFRNGEPLDQSLVLPTMTLLLQNVSKADNGIYNCSANNYITGEIRRSDQKTYLTVTSSRNHEEPKFLSVPPSNYTVTAGQNVFMECSAVGNPPPTVIWRKLSGGEINPKKSKFLPGGLQINNVTSKDEGTYVCEHGKLKHHITLFFYEKPTVEFSPPSNITEGENVDFECAVTGTPDPVISWFINGHTALNDSNIEVVENKIYFQSIEKRHAGILQCLASNEVGATYGFEFIKIFPKQISTAVELTTERVKPKTEKAKKVRVKNPVMMPPSKPIITRLSDESVMVRWSVPENDGLPIQFFKVQYRELGSPASQTNPSRNKGSRWKTTNADIIPHLRSYQVDNLKPDHIYRFRIAAVYSNNDNKLGQNSAKFHLKREDFFMKDPLPVPKLTRTEALSPYTIKIYWDYTPNPNVTIDGFYVNYQLTSSAGEYFKATVDGEKTRTYTINHLQPDTAYDIKLQSYRTSGASDFSAVLQQKTLRLPEAEITSIPPSSKKEESTDGPPQLYIIIGAATISIALIIAGIIIFYICKKKKEKEGQGIEGDDRTDKIGVPNEDRRHHIQVESNGYIPKAIIPRGLSNGCGPQPNRITITSNPLADADDNQNQNMIEMSCLSSQNNNCSAVEPSVSSNDNEVTQPLPSKLKKSENIKTRGKLKNELKAGENYV